MEILYLYIYSKTCLGWTVMSNHPSWMPTFLGMDHFWLKRTYREQVPSKCYHTNCSCNHCFHLLTATGTCFVVGFEFTKHLYRQFIWLVDLFDWYIKVCEKEGALLHWCHLYISRQLNIYWHCVTSVCSQISPSSMVQFAKHNNCFSLSVLSSLNTCIVNLSDWSIYLIDISKCARKRGHCRTGAIYTSADNWTSIGIAWLRFVHKSAPVQWLNLPSIIIAWNWTMQ